MMFVMSTPDKNMPGQASQTSSSPEYITPTQKKNVMCYVLIEAKGQMLYSYCFSYFLSFEPPPPYCNLSFTLVSMLFLNSCGESSQRVSYDLITLQLFKNSIDTQEKLRLNLYSLSVSVSKLSEYRR